MNLETTISIFGGGLGSGCNPAVGKCGRKGGDGNELKGALVGDGFYGNGKFHEEKDFGFRLEEHAALARRVGLASKDSADPIKDALKAGWVRVVHYSHSSTVSFEAWSRKEPNLRDAILRLPASVEKVSWEVWYPKEAYVAGLTKEKALEELGD